TMEETKRLYETTIIVNASLEDPQIEAIIARIQEVITKNAGEIVAVNRWGRKRMMYQIKKKNSGYYVNIEFNAPTTIVKALEHVFMLDEHIIRYLTIKVEKKALQSRAQAALRKEEEDSLLLEIPTIEELKEPLFDDEPVVL
ncbi:MAG: 30S ribosomal protein S6, partial [Ignavibacteriae bacterium]|nr:30S ribosomal protein S6 [Ignavibacteriota bacterium]